MPYIDAFKSYSSLIELLGEGSAHLIWALGMYLEEPDLEALASEALTDGPDDKKIDFIRLDQDSKRILFAQGFYGTSKRDAAPANKASDLNTAAAWLLSGPIGEVPRQLQPIIEECRHALDEGEIEYIELLYVHNYPESVNVNTELQTAASHLRTVLGEGSTVVVNTKELGSSALEHLFVSQESQIIIKDEIICPAKIAFQEIGPKWKASILSVPGIWLYELFKKHGDDLFSANYRGFLGITKRKKINTAIRGTAELKPKDFWSFNNGITILTLGLKGVREVTRLTGISIINGAQTTGAIGSVDLTKHDLKDVQVLCRIIQCTDNDTISDIIKYNNTQNEITTWDQYSNDPEQERIDIEFKSIGYNYSRKRGFRKSSDEIGIEDVTQPLIAFSGRFKDANRGKNQIFDQKYLYKRAFEGKKARHILFVNTLARAIDERRIALKNKSNNGTILVIEEAQLSLFRNIKFKYYLISIIAKVLESIIDRRVNPLTIAFSPEAAKAENKSYVALVAAWLPIVKVVLSFVATNMDPNEFFKVLKEENPIERIANLVNAMIYASKTEGQYADFIELITDS